MCGWRKTDRINHPILNFKTKDALKMVHITCNKDEIFLLLLVRTMLILCNTFDNNADDHYIKYFNQGKQKI